MSELSVDTLSGSSGVIVTIKTGHTLTLVEDLDAGTAKLTNVGEPTASSDAATKNYVDTQLLTLDTLGELTNVTITSVSDNEVLAYDSTSSEWINQTASEAGLATSGDLTSHSSDTSNPHSVTVDQAFSAGVPTGDLNINSNKLTSVSDPTAAQDAATKAYVDSQVASKDDLSELTGTSDDITEGTTNLFLTNERIDDRFNDLFQAGTALTGTYDDASNTYTLNVDSLTNTNIDASAAIDQSKLNLAITNSEVDASAAIDQSKLNLAITDSEVDASAAIDATKIHDGSVTNAEFGYIGGLTSDAQTQLDAKLALSGGTMTGELDLLSFSETYVSGSSGTSFTIDTDDTSVYLFNASGNTTINFTNVPSGVTKTIFMRDASNTAGHTFTWQVNGSTITPKFVGGTAHESTANYDLITFLSIGNGEYYISAQTDWS